VIAEVEIGIFGCQWHTCTCVPLADFVLFMTTL